VNDTRWSDVSTDLAAARWHLSNAIRLFDQGGLTGDDLEAYRQQMALLHAMQSGYTSLEAGLLRVLQILGEAQPAGPDWHAALIRRVCRHGPGRPAIFEADLCRDLEMLRAFRHVATHVYDAFDSSRASLAVDAARRAEPQIEDQFARFVAVIDPD
jgi:hypothetical protein